MHIGDFIEKSKEFISDNSIDVLFTDPIYRFNIYRYMIIYLVSLYELKDGGSLVTYVGNYALPQVIHMMESEGLKYWWTTCKCCQTGKFKLYFAILLEKLENVNRLPNLLNMA